MEKAINTSRDGHVLVTYFEVCNPDPVVDGNDVPIYKPYNEIKRATLYGVDIHSGKTVRLDLSAGDLKSLRRAIDEIELEDYRGMTQEQYQAYVNQ